MGKITVKHYLNKNIKSRLDGSSNAYPLYVQIIANRINYKMKSNFSFWDGYIKESDYNTEFIQHIIKREQEQLELIVGYLIDHNKTEFLNADSFKKLSAPLWDYLSENFWKIFVDEGEAVYNATLPNAFYNTVFYEIYNIIDFTNSEIENKFSEKYKCLRIGMTALQYAFLGNESQDLNIKTISVFDFVFGKRKKDVVKAIDRYRAFYLKNEIENKIDDNTIKDDNILQAIIDFIFDKFK